MQLHFLGSGFEAGKGWKRGWLYLCLSVDPLMLIIGLWAVMSVCVDSVGVWADQWVLLESTRRWRDQQCSFGGREGASTAPCQGRLDAEHTAKQHLDGSALVLLGRNYINWNVSNMATLYSCIWSLVFYHWRIAKCSVSSWKLRTGRVLYVVDEWAKTVPSNSD